MFSRAAGADRRGTLANWNTSYGLLAIASVAMRSIVCGREPPALIFLFPICPSIDDNIFASTGIANEYDFLILCRVLGGGHGALRKVYCITTVEHLRPENMSGLKFSMGDCQNPGR
jgi:hypothetical protein